MSDRRIVDDLHEAVALLEFDDVIYYEVRGQRRDGFDNIPPFEGGEDDVPNYNLQMLSSEVEDRIAIRGQLTTEMPEFLVLVDMAVVFVKTDEFDLTQGIRDSFIANVGVMTLYPYLREAVHELTAKMGKAYRLSVLRRDHVLQQLEND